MTREWFAILALAGAIGTAHAGLPQRPRDARSVASQGVADVAPGSAFAVVSHAGSNLANANDPNRAPIATGIGAVRGIASDGIFCNRFEASETGACDLVPGAWVAATTGPSARYRAGGTSDGTYVYVYGGGNAAAEYLADLWRWNPATETWTQLADMPTGKQNIQGSYLAGKIYVPGGYTGMHIDENAIYDIATNTWTTGAPLPIAHTGTTAAYGGKIYVFGGNGANTRVDAYDPVGDSWTQLANFPTSITYGRAVAAGSFIYYVGGVRDATEVTTDVWRYDPATDTYAAMASLQAARTSAEVMAFADRIYAVDGGGVSFFTGLPLPNTVEVYDIPGNTWTYGHPTLQTMSAPAGGVAGGKLMIMGGVDSSTYFDNVQVSPLIGQ
jgi:N-acetylneuraminic acid mutarotase